MTSLPPLYPLLFSPIYKDYIWGGDRIVRCYHRPVPPGVYAESWEISDRSEDMSLVTNGPLAGQAFHDLVRDYGGNLVGTLCPGNRFPFLMKILDARDRLSVQVHPDDTSAKAVQGEPKTEMWYVLDADPGAMVFAGVKPGIQAALFRQAIEKGTVADMLNSIPVLQGDIIYIPGGRIHSIGAGCLLLEIQQNSDTTFRVFDWNRVGHDGKPRELHVDRAMQVIRWHDDEPVRLPAPAHLLNDVPSNGAVYERLTSPYFWIEQMVVSKSLKRHTTGRSFHILFIETGTVQVKGRHHSVDVESGMTLLIPAAMGEYDIISRETPARVIQISLPGEKA